MLTWTIRHPEDPLQDILEVGSQKPVGFVPVQLIWAEGLPKELIIGKLQSNGKECIEVVCSINEEMALFVFDPIALKALLDAHQKILQENSWTTSPLEFVKRIAKETVSQDSPIFDIISLAYGNDPQAVRKEIEEEILRERIDRLHQMGNW